MPMSHHQPTKMAERPREMAMGTRKMSGMMKVMSSQNAGSLKSSMSMRCSP